MPIEEDIIFEHPSEKDGFQRIRFKTITNMVNDLFESKNSTDNYTEISNAIISFLKVPKMKISAQAYSRAKEIPYKDLNSNLKDILKKEFL